MERCPNCSARVGEGTSCRRCGMELGLLMEAEGAAEQALIRGIRRLAQGDTAGAQRDFARSQALFRTPLAEHLARLAALGPRHIRRPHHLNAWTPADPPVFDLVTPLCGTPREERLPPMETLP